MKSYKARGVVLRTVKYGESGMVVYMLTNTLGRQTYMVQGVRSSKGKGNKGALFQPMFIVEFEGIESQHAQMHRMKDIRNFMPLSTVPFDVRKSTISLFMAEVVYRLIREVEQNSPLFEFVCGAIEALDAMHDGVANFHLWFLVRLSYFLGFYPGNQYIEDGVFDIQNGVFTPSMPTHRLALSPQNSHILAQVMSCEVENLGSLQLSRNQRSDFMNGILTYFGYHLDSIHHVQSLQILREVF